jgi:hypothetical protein
MAQKKEIKKAIEATIVILSLNFNAFFLASMAQFSAQVNKRPLGLIYEILLHIGLSQLVYIIPLIFWAQYTRKWELLKGIIAAAILTILINGSCGFLSFK